MVIALCYFYCIVLVIVLKSIHLIWIQASFGLHMVEILLIPCDSLDINNYILH